MCIRDSKKTYREALLKRLEEFDGDPKKAFTGKNSPAKKPILLIGHKENQVPEKIKLVELQTIYTSRKAIDEKIKLEKIIDVGIRRKLEKHLRKFNDDYKLAFGNLNKNPIWLDEENGITLKRITIEGPKSVEAIHEKKNLSLIHISEPTRPY